MAVAGEEMQVDFVWHEQRVIVETDGFGTHGTRQAFQRDRRRDQLLTLAGWRVIRFTWDQVTNEPRYVIDVMRELMSATCLTHRWAELRSHTNRNSARGGVLAPRAGRC